MATKILPPLVLPVRAYAELERQAREQDRSPSQQARFLLKRALLADGQPAGCRPSAAGHGGR
jgi:hypothetical protein